LLHVYCSLAASKANDETLILIVW